MPQLKARSGTSASVRSCIDYLTRGGRAFAADFINCSEVDERGREVWRQMDDTRRLFGNDVPARSGNGRVRTFEHLILSPDPKDGIPLEKLRELATAWAWRHFGDYEVAIYYHDDNRLRIPHAHIVVNNTNLKDGRRLAPKLTKGAFRRMSDDLQDMAREMGLSAFRENYEARESGEIATVTQNNARTRAERAILAEKGYSWKEDIRQRLRCAVKLSYGNAEFLASCTALGLDYRVDRRGDWVFSIAGHPTWQVAGRRLGFDYSRRGIEGLLMLGRTGNGRKVGRMQADLIRATISPIVAAGGPTPNILGIIDGREFTVGDVAEMLDLCEKLDIRSADDFADALSDSMRDSARSRLEHAQRLAESLGHLPDHRPREYGRRLEEKHNHHDSEPSNGSHSSYTHRHSAPEPSYYHIDIGER
ncbi:MAG: relaxase/mobilization nuclease domain-containing protein [Atopobiaceae bacterium]|nr:relaxase/mobilization nuclease domain-containing protein [Atopobiaceae bacterium]